MFVALDMAPQAPQGILQRARGILTRPKVELEPAECGGGAYALLHVRHGRRMPVLRELLEIAGEQARWILLPEGIELPPDSPLEQYSTTAFDQEVLLHTATAIIAETRMPLYRRVLGLIDEDGSFADLLHPLLRHYSTVRVLTRNRERYLEAAEEMMEELGAPVLIGGSLASFSDCVLVLSPGSFSSVEEFRLPCPVLTLGALSLRYRVEQISHLRAALPTTAREPPPGISPHRLAGALYELSEAKEIRPVASRLMLDGRETVLADAVQAVIRAANAPKCDNSC